MINLDAYAPLLEAVQQSQNGRVVGSVGRMAIFQQQYCNPNMEFKARTEELTSGATRKTDIDIIGLTADELDEIKELPSSISIDDSFHTDELSIRPRMDGTWRIYSKTAKLQKDFPAPFMAKNLVVVEGITIPTVSLVAHAAINDMRPKMEKDTIAQSLLNEALDDSQTTIRQGLRVFVNNMRSGIDAERVASKRQYVRSSAQAITHRRDS